MAGGLGGVRGVGGVSRKRIKKLQLSLLPQGVVFRQAVGDLEMAGIEQDTVTNAWNII